MPEQEPPRLGDGEVVKERWKVVTSLGTGAFGAVYMVEDLRATGAAAEKRYAMKTEERGAVAQILKMEIAVLKKLGEQAATHSCRMVSRGKTDRLNFLVMSLCGKSLQQLRKNRPSKSFSLGTSLRVGTETLKALQELHLAGFIHRDVKPGNFAVGRKAEKAERNVLILDFGLARAFRNKDGTLRTPRESTGFRGTVRYAPMACHRKEELSRKDDLESWLYQLVELMAGQLPWHATNDKAAVMEAKLAARRTGALFHSAAVPSGLKDVLDSLDRLHYVDEPDYQALAALLGKLARSHNVRPDAPLDWELLPDLD